MSADMNDESDVITMTDIVEHEARNLTGCDNDDSCCTFPKGYVSRQAIYLCLTCLKETGKAAGICYPCSIHCHNDHQLLDLYTKRSFRCDCGNASFPSEFNCKLWEDKDDINEKNKYNHNFSGLFCICESEYKDSEEQEDMYQCALCEDWFHQSHINSADITDNTEDYTCGRCLSQQPFLMSYMNQERPLSTEKEECLLQASIAPPPAPLSGWFWPQGWRDQLCRCRDCHSMMQDRGLSFLLDEGDTVTNYYNQADGNDDDREQIAEALAGLPFEQAIVVAEGVAQYKRELARFVAQFDHSKIVTSEDVQLFFDGLKKRRLDEHDSQ